jgi:flagellar biosynthesis/type III secretory pathway protein FliH
MCRNTAGAVRVKFHQYSEVFPLLGGIEFDALVADIKEHGLREPIWRYKKSILDGRNRFLACQKAKVKPKYRDFKGKDESALAFVVSSNVHRRHLTDSQRAMAAAKIATLRDGVRADRQGAQICAPRQEDAAQTFDVSRRSIQHARKVLDEGSKALQRAVDAGEVAVSRAASVVDLPKSEQLAAATTKPTKPDITDDHWTPDDDEDKQIEHAEKEYAASIDKVMAADDKLAAAHAEIKRQAAEIGMLTFSRDGYLNGKAGVTRLLKKEQRKTEQLSKQLDKARAEIDKLRERVAIMEESA